MVRPAHHEHHFGQSELVRDLVIGAADGLTVPFALAAGLAGAVASSGIVVTAGLAEIAAGSIAMGLGGYLAARSESDHYHSELDRERTEVRDIPDHERREVSEILETYGLHGEVLEKTVDALTRDPDRWVDFMMRFELGLEKPKQNRARISALSIGGSYFAGGLVPLLPYMLMPRLIEALWVSAAATLAILFTLGALKGKFTGMPPLRAGAQTALVGGIAAAAAFLVARLVV
ncbi:MAG: VIT1/CCC1 transporter family protein [Stenotrophobium sp.]